MSGEEISVTELMRLFEAARWAPSSYNGQPWRFIYAKRNSEPWDKLFSVARKTENQFNNKTIFIIADMSVFNHTKKASELLEYEKTLHKGLKVERWKKLYLYHKRDFQSVH